MGAAAGLAALLAVATGGMYAVPDAIAQAPAGCHSDRPGLSICIKDRYVKGDVINISGVVYGDSIRDGVPVTIIVASPIGNIIDLRSVELDADGNFSASVGTGGSNFRYGGMYEVRAQYASLRVSATFEFFLEPTCSVGIGAADLNMYAAPGERSAPVRQVISNQGTLSFERVDLTATPWRIEPGGVLLPEDAPPPPRPVLSPPEPLPPEGAPPALLPEPVPPEGTPGSPLGLLTVRLVATLPASVTEISTAGAGAGYGALAEGTAVAHGLEGGGSVPLWFRVNLPSGLQGGALVQNVEYQAMCMPP